MYCPKCGWQNADNASGCANCGRELPVAQTDTPQQPQQPQQPPAQQPYTQQPYGQHTPGGQYQQGYQNDGYAASWDVPNYLAWSIVATALSVLCCNILALPFGIVAIVKSVAANNKKLAWDYYGAVADAGSAKTWTLVCTVLLVTGIVLAGFLVASGILSESGPGFE